jgi:hypothetical protein
MRCTFPINYLTLLAACQDPTQVPFQHVVFYQLIELDLASVQ